MVPILITFLCLMQTVNTLSQRQPFLRLTLTHLIYCGATRCHRELEDGKGRGVVNSSARGVVSFQQAD